MFRPFINEGTASWKKLNEVILKGERGDCLIVIEIVILLI